MYWAFHHPNWLHFYRWNDHVFLLLKTVAMSSAAFRDSSRCFCDEISWWWESSRMSLLGMGIQVDFPRDVVVAIYEFKCGCNAKTHLIKRVSCGSSWPSKCDGTDFGWSLLVCVFFLTPFFLAFFWWGFTQIQIYPDIAGISMGHGDLRWSLCCEKTESQSISGWWWMVAMNLAFSQKYWVAIIIP